MHNVYTVHCAYRMYSILQCTMYNLQCTLYNALYCTRCLDCILYTGYTMFCILYSMMYCVIYFVKCTFTVHSTTQLVLYNILLTVQCIMYCLLCSV
jgi:hypothetical protein